MKPTSRGGLDEKTLNALQLLKVKYTVLNSYWIYGGYLCCSLNFSIWLDVEIRLLSTNLHINI